MWDLYKTMFLLCKILNQEIRTFDVKVNFSTENFTNTVLIKYTLP